MKETMNKNNNGGNCQFAVLCLKTVGMLTILYDIVVYFYGISVI